MQIVETMGIPSALFEVERLVLCHLVIIEAVGAMYNILIQLKYHPTPKCFR